jgi:exopolyphosphatase/pppGpp-phosphohydrolase
MDIGIFSPPLIEQHIEYVRPADTQAAIDIGSGLIKLFVGRQTDEGIEKIFVTTEKIAFNDHLIQKGDTFELDQKIQEIALEALLKLSRMAKEYGSVRIKGIATEVFRKAINGQEVLENLAKQTGIDLEIASPEVESAMGFNSVFGFATGHKPENLIVFETGSSSSQISFEGHSISLPIGTTTAVKLLSEGVRKVKFDSKKVNGCVSIDEVNELKELLSEQIRLACATDELFAKALQDKLRNPFTQVAGIGYGGVVKQAIDQWPYAYTVSNITDKVMPLSKLNEFIATLTNRDKTDEVLTSLKDLYPTTVVAGVTMLAAFSESLNFSEVEWLDIPAGGGTYQYLYGSK